MGGFEIILVFIGIVWSIASAVVQNKKKRAAAKKRAMLMEESGGSSRDQLDEEPRAEVSIEAQASPAPSIQSLFEGSLADRFEAIKRMRLERMQSEQEAAASIDASSGASNAGPAGRRTPSVPVPIQPSLSVAAPSSAPQTPPMVPEAASEADQVAESPSASRKSMSLSAWQPEAKQDAVASKLREALKSRSSLKAAFLLKEVLDPPLALRSSEI